MRISTFSAVFLFTVFTSPVFAEGTKTCNVKTFAKVLIEADKATDEKKDMAIAELKKARAKMAENDDAACSVHLAKAHDMVAAK